MQKISPRLTDRLTSATPTTAWYLLSTCALVKPSSRIARSATSGFAPKTFQTLEISMRGASLMKDIAFVSYGVCRNGNLHWPQHSRASAMNSAFKGRALRRRDLNSPQPILLQHLRHPCHWRLFQKLGRRHHQQSRQNWQKIQQ